MTVQNTSCFKLTFLRIHKYTGAHVFTYKTNIHTCIHNTHTHTSVLVDVSAPQDVFDVHGHRRVASADCFLISHKFTLCCDISPYVVISLKPYVPQENGCVSFPGLICLFIIFMHSLPIWFECTWVSVNSVNLFVRDVSDRTSVTVSSDLVTHTIPPALKFSPRPRTPWCDFEILVLQFSDPVDSWESWRAGVWRVKDGGWRMGVIVCLCVDDAALRIYDDSS